MKSKLSFLLAIFMVLSGCNKIKEATSITVDTTLQSDIPVTVPAGKSLGGDNALTFTKTQDLSLQDNSDLSPYLSKIDQITLSNLVIVVTGLTADQIINSISLDVAGVGTVCTATDITISNNTFTPTVSTTVFEQMAAKLEADKKLTLTVSGSVSGSMTFVVGCNMTAKVVVFTI